MSVAASSSRFSRHSRRARVIDYYKLAQEVINGKPVSEIEDRDVRSTVVSLCVIRSQVGAAGEADRAASIAELIRVLNKRLQPPAVLRRGGSSTVTRSTGAQSSEGEIPPASGIDFPGPKSPVTIRELADDEREELSRILNDLLNGGQIDIDDTTEGDKRRKLLFLIHEHINAALNEYNYTRVQLLHIASDKVCHVSNPHIAQRMLKLAELQERLATLIAHREDLTSQLAAIEEQLEKDLAQKTEEMAPVFIQQLQQIEDDCPPIENPHLFGRWTSFLLGLRDKARRYAQARDYEAAITDHRRAEHRQAQEIQRKEITRDIRIDRLRTQKMDWQELTLAAAHRRISSAAQKEIRKKQHELYLTAVMITATENDLERLKRRRR
jgi:hypothetical protein